MLVSMETHNSYHDIMRMPYSAFLGYIKQIRLRQLMQNPEWREAYLKWQYQEDYTNGNIVKQTKPDLQGLLALQESE